MPTFVDKRGRVITIEEGGNDIFAFHDGKQIGDLLTTGQESVDDRMPLIAPQITGWEVDAEYRRAGICAEMLRYAVEEHFGEPLRPADRYLGYKNENALTDDGVAMTEWGQAKGYILPFADALAEAPDES